MLKQPPELVVGVIGGLGPEATHDFFGKLLRHTNAATDQDHLHVIIENNPKVPNRNDAIAGRGPSSGPMLAGMAKVLDEAGADFIVMACNTAHAFETDIRSATRKPFVSMIGEVVREVAGTAGPSAVIGLLAAQGCIDSRIYHDAFGKRDVAVLQLDPRDQGRFMELLYRIKSGERGTAITGAMCGLAQQLVAQGATILIAACTEVPLVLGPDDVDVPFIDSTDVLARRCVAYARHAEPLPDTLEKPL